MSDAARLAIAVVWIWLGMVLGVSFLEAPLKFRAQGLEIRVGLAIGRIVFRALNAVEVGLAAVVAICLLVDAPPTATVVVAVAAGAVLVAQLVVVRPRLNRRTNRVLAGEDVPRSSAHHIYIALEIVKVAALVALGIRLLTD